jgi:hypothetical protein
METNISLSKEAYQLLRDDEARAYYSELKMEGYLLFISKKQYAKIANCSLSTVDNNIKRGYGLPNYKKIGIAKNAKVIFSLIDVANYFASETIKTA